ncbi:hypothetical protein JHG98_004322 [Salmonella enterica]|nr:hypothetical protein [Salmonella enterica subsp. enterica serovar Panama]EGX9180299.1 hypothetical protein [Salmonella enterica]EGZ6497057.1 hypothetical protein [Salmonella enterica]
MLSSEKIKPGGYLTAIHDQKLTELLHLISRNIEMAQSKDELIATIGQVKSFGGPLKFRHSRYKILALIASLFALATGLYSDEFYIKFHYQLIPFTVSFALCTAALIFYMWRKSARVRSLAERLYLRALLFDNQLQELTSELSLFESQLFNNYCEFRRGNYSREIKKGYRGNYKGNIHTFDYTVYHFHYVDQRTVTERDSKGHTRTRTVYDHYDRYGIALDFRFVTQLAITGKSISGFKGKCYKTSSNGFNRQFKVVAQDEMVAARFLMPAVVLACEESSKEFESLNLEFNSVAGLCMSFDNDNVVYGEPQFDFNSPDDFMYEVREYHSLRELRVALEFIHTLMMFSDNNFRKDNE